MKERKTSKDHDTNQTPSPQRIRVRGTKFPVFDADAKPIYVGDTLEWQRCVGPYGKTKRGRGKVTHEMLLCGSIITDGGTVSTQWEWKPKDGPEGLYCRSENQTYDHAHKTWARVIATDAETTSMTKPDENLAL
jgi:hypothetical protein